MFMPLACAFQPALGLIVMSRTWEFPIFGLIYRAWRIYIMFSSSIVAMAFAATLLLPESPKFLLAMGRPTETLAILRMMYRWNTGMDEKVRLKQQQLQKTRSIKCVCRHFRWRALSWNRWDQV